MIDIESWKETFVTDEFLNKARLYLTKLSDGELSTTTKFEKISWTPRELQLQKHKTISLIPFYYIDYILKHSSSDKLFDIGCGFNFFKNFYNVTGFDNTEEADIQCLFDESFVEQYENKLDNAIAINSLHFVELTNIRERILEFYRVIKSDGYGYLTFNMTKLLTDAPDTDINWAFEYAKKEIEKTNIDFLSVYIDNTIVNEYIDGNIRLLFKKEEKL
jgi:hypothetical protein